jgi:hypothetical protein
MSGSAPITEDEVRDLVLGFFHSMHAGGPVQAQRPMFAPGVGIETWLGAAFPLDEHLRLHRAFARERHTILALDVRPTPDGRAHAVGAVEWEAVVRDTGAVIQAAVDEDWIVERGEDGGPRFARDRSTGIRYLPGSATLELWR